MKLFTIGFTKRTAEEFFTALQAANVRRIVDVRINNTSQLAGFAKARDLEYFLRAVAGIDYIHLPAFAPTQELLDDYKKKKGDWESYERGFAALMNARGADATARDMLRDGDCLLCSEYAPEHCHRRLLAERFSTLLDNVKVAHL